MKKKTTAILGYLGITPTFAFAPAFICSTSMSFNRYLNIINEKCRCQRSIVPNKNHFVRRPTVYLSVRLPLLLLQATQVLREKIIYFFPFHNSTLILCLKNYMIFLRLMYWSALNKNKNNSWKPKTLVLHIPVLYKDSS